MLNDKGIMKEIGGSTVKHFYSLDAAIIIARKAHISANGCDANINNIFVSVVKQGVASCFAIAINGKGCGMEPLVKCWGAKELYEDRTNKKLHASIEDLELQSVLKSIYG